MRRKRQRTVTLEQMPAHMWPDYDRFNSPSEEKKRRQRSDWLREHDLADDYFQKWLPAYLAERRRLAGLPPRPPARRRGPLPDEVRRLLASIEEEQTP